MIQGGALGVGEEERGVGKFLACAEKMLPRDSASGVDSHGSAQVDLTSGYFGLYHTYKKAVLEGNAPYRIVAAAPEVSFTLRCVSDRDVTDRYWITILKQRQTDFSARPGCRD